MNVKCYLIWKLNQGQSTICWARDRTIIKIYHHPSPLIFYNRIWLLLKILSSLWKKYKRNLHNYSARLILCKSGYVFNTTRILYQRLKLQANRFNLKQTPFEMEMKCSIKCIPSKQSDGFYTSCYCKLLSLKTYFLDISFNSLFKG